MLKTSKTKQTLQIAPARNCNRLLGGDLDRSRLSLRSLDVSDLASVRAAPETADSPGASGSAGAAMCACPACADATAIPAAFGPEVEDMVAVELVICRNSIMSSDSALLHAFEILMDLDSLETVSLFFLLTPVRGGEGGVLDLLTRSRAGPSLGTADFEGQRC